ncbi:TetR/AcrR family transcriptional regulator [Pseudofrankia sp. BMG5.37]|uniref:TetR/AcrR family transcriptional regulator n=1 Tax=Pseudofrankia sp. BMG5.37 TaxID=3050035 RepID=UPI0028949CD9|nr:TetR/AcrR family transcriptional regulator [Pseudofrankia sp. BMG5.37]MDT3444248.1 TetR/AcrR family transcriptional regulator [Pseudofrankia sp. BMG5.37]
MARPPARPAGEKSTREQILDVALQLFTANGYEKTSLREIAERMNFSKAALYYHFASKDDILLALHLRLHDIGKAGLERIEADRVRPADWVPMIDEFVDLILENRQLFMFHLRNHAALEGLQDHEHDGANQDMEERARRLLTDPGIPQARRLRLSFALGAVIFGLVMTGDVLAETPTEELRAELRSVVRDILEPGGVSPDTDREGADAGGARDVPNGGGPSNGGGPRNGDARAMAGQGGPLPLAGSAG